MSSIFKNIDLQKRRIKTLEGISLLTLYLLTYLMKSNLINFPSTIARSAKKIKNNKEIFNVIKSKVRIAALIHLQQVLILFSRKKGKMSPILNTFIIEKKVIILISVLKIRTKSYKIIFGLDNLYASDCS